MIFKKLDINDKEKLNIYFQKNTRRCCEYSFACNFIWQDMFNYSYAIIENCYVARFKRESGFVYNLPLGENENVIKAIKTILNFDKTAVFRAIEQENISLLKENLGDIFEFSYSRNESDYIYLSENLINLQGKKYQSKRNLIRRFNDNPDWVYEDITRNNVRECISLNLLWGDERDISVLPDLRKEIAAANTALAYLEKLNLKGGLLRQNGEVIAYSIGERLSDDTFVVHFEKAKDDIKGAYQAINNEFVKHNCDGFKYVNREEDAGEEGLRKAKLSYHPEIILNKYEAKLKC